MEKRIIVGMSQLTSGEFSGYYSLKTSEMVAGKPGLLLHPTLVKSLVAGLNPALFMPFEWLESEIIFMFLPEGTVLKNGTVCGKNTHVDLLSLALKPTAEFREEIRKQAIAHAEEVAASSAPVA